MREKINAVGEDSNSSSQFRATFRIENIGVISRGQITLPSESRTEYDITQGEYIELILYYNGEKINVGDRKVGESGRVTIPNTTRERHGINQDDTVDGVVKISNS